MKIERTTFFVAVHMFFVRNGRILLLKRFNTGYCDGQYSVPAGHVDGRESIGEAMMRETREEVGIELINPPKIIHVMHRVQPSEVRIDYFGLITDWEGSPINNEPDKCSEITWELMNKLPSNTIPYIRQALIYYLENRLFSDFNEG